MNGGFIIVGSGAVTQQVWSIGHVTTVIFGVDL